MEIRNIYEFSGWYASYLPDDQGSALIYCLGDRIHYDRELFEKILREIELAENPKEYDPDMILQSIKALIENRQICKRSCGYFGWEG